MKPSKRSPWQHGNIADTYKAMIEMNPRNIHNPHMMITHTQQSFLQLLGYDYDSLPLPLEEIISSANIRSTLSAIERSIMKGRTTVHHINLRNHEGHALSCQITIVGFPIPARVRNEKPKKFIYNQNIPGTMRIAVMTVRSASLVGNTVLETALVKNTQEKEDWKQQLQMMNVRKEMKEHHENTEHFSGAEEHKTGGSDSEGSDSSISNPSHCSNDSSTYS